MMRTVLCQQVHHHLHKKKYILNDSAYINYPPAKLDSTVNDAMNVLGENLFTDILLVLVALITNFNFHDSGQASIQAGN